MSGLILDLGQYVFNIDQLVRGSFIGTTQLSEITRDTFGIFRQQH